MEMYELKNFNGVMAIVSALQLTCIKRLGLSWKLLPLEDKEFLDRLKVEEHYTTFPCITSQ